jgi:hypothetical protein
MKKIVLALLLLAVVALAALYLLIPSTLTITKTLSARANQHSVYRALVNEKDWLRWWPGDHKNNVFRLNGVNYTEGRQQFTAQEILVQSEDDRQSHSSQIIIVSADVDSVQVGWEMKLETGTSPFARFNNYRKAQELGRNMEQILSAFGTYISKKSNLYGFDIRETKVKDTVMMGTKGTTTGFPPVSHTYSLINKVKEHIRKTGGQETNNPMMHVMDLGNNQYETMVAIPVNKLLPESKDVYVKRMILGNILEGEVKGGYGVILSSLKSMDYYIKDYRKTPPAIPFQMIITDRSAEPDSSKWVTRLYYPVY